MLHHKPLLASIDVHADLRLVVGSFHVSKKLTRCALDACLKSATNGAWLWCRELRGFGVHCRDNGQAAFVVQFRVGRGRHLAKCRRVVLGKHPTMPLNRPEKGQQNT